MHQFEIDLEAIKNTAISAGKAILEYYQKSDIGLEKKADNSPLTLADKAAHELIKENLKDTGWPVLSEEGEAVPYHVRKSWEYYWLVDPLDGTKEFVKRNGEFTVNIALIHKGGPVLGVVYAPVLEDLYWGQVGKGAWKMDSEGEEKSIQVSLDKQINTIVASRSHLNKETEDFLQQYPNAEIISMGSSLKILLIAEGRAQLYPRFGPTMEWDTAAAHAIVKAAGGNVTDLQTGKELLYNKEDLLNPYFVVAAENLKP